MAEAVLSAVVEGVVSSVISLAKEQIDLARGFEDDLQKLGDSLAIIQAFLQDAGEKQTKNSSVKCWLEKLKNLAYDADDVLDELAYENLRREVENGNHKRSKVLDFLSPSTIAFCYKMANKMKDILKSLDDLNKLANEFGLQHIAIDHKTPVFPRSNVETASFLDDSKIFGRKNDISKVVNLLINPNDDQVVSVVPILGMAGLGKTTLAKLVYDDVDVNRHFDVKFWVCVSDNFDVKRILREMLDHFTNEHIFISENKNVIIEKLKGKMEHVRRGKEQIKYLLVLDDVWNVEKWEELNSELIGVNRNKGNKIVVTTRCQDVASKVETLPNGRHQPGTLEVDECWSIIKERAFRGTRMSQELEVIGKGIAEQCQGVPLIAKVIGGIMCNIEMNPGAWLKIQKSDVWDSVESVLKLSFDHLSSPSLKKCFAYCAMFPKDFCFEKEQLIQIWMAEGFLQAPRDNSVTMMDIGNKYFNELVSNSLFQDVEMDKCGNILTCKMHDMVHDLALSVSKFETLISEENSNSIADEVSHIRHLNINYDGESLPRILTAVAPRLLSLFSKVDVFKVMSLTFKSLRVLKFCGADYILVLPDSLGKLMHLRYLDISKTSIRALPPSITKLYKLQTLRFMGCWELTLPDGLRNLISLRHIHFDQESLQPIELRHLTSLQTLPMFVVGDLLERRIDALKCLNQLGGELSICKLEFVRDKDEAMGADLCKKSRLGKLIFEWSYGRESYGNDEEVLENLQPPPNLQSLIIRGYAGEYFPSWMLRPVHGSSTGLFLLNNVMELELIDCISCKSLPPLGQLQNLKFLTLANMLKVECMGNEFYYDANSDGKNEVFPALKRFTLVEMENLEEWTAMAATVVMFPRLEELDIYECPLLISVPLTGQCSSLETVSIRECSNLSSIGDGLAASTRLKELTIVNCPNLSSIPGLEGFSSLRSLEVSFCHELESVPLTGRCSFLEKLRIFGCEKLSKIGDGLSAATGLKELSLIFCPNLISIPDLEGFSSLQSLHVSECDELEIVLLRGRCSSLENLNISNCQKLIKIGDGLSTSTCLKVLWLENCPDLSSIPDLEGSSSLRSLHVSECDKLEIVPLRGRCSSLENLNISNCPNLNSLPNLEGLSSLQSLKVVDCCKLRSFLDDSLVSLTRLRNLKIGGFSEELEGFPGLNSIQHLGASLRSLNLIGWKKLKSLPHQLQHLTALQELRIESFQGIEALPEWLGNLSSLEQLGIISCDNLMYLPSLDVMRSLSKLSKFYISSCPQLKSRCARESGPEWSKISHIPSIRINYKDIQKLH